MSAYQLYTLSSPGLQRILGSHRGDAMTAFAREILERGLPGPHGTYRLVEYYAVLVQGEKYLRSNVLFEVDEVGIHGRALPEHKELSTFAAGDELVRGWATAVIELNAFHTGRD